MAVYFMSGDEGGAKAVKLVRAGKEMSFAEFNQLLLEKNPSMLDSRDPLARQMLRMRNFAVAVAFYLDSFSAVQNHDAVAGIISFHDELHENALARADMVNAVNFHRKIAAGIESMICGETAFGENPFRAAVDAYFPRMGRDSGRLCGGLLKIIGNASNYLGGGNPRFHMLEFGYAPSGKITHCVKGAEITDSSERPLPELSDMPQKLHDDFFRLAAGIGAASAGMLLAGYPIVLGAFRFGLSGRHISGTERVVRSVGGYIASSVVVWGFASDLIGRDSIIPGIAGGVAGYFFSCYLAPKFFAFFAAARVAEPLRIDSFILDFDGGGIEPIGFKQCFPRDYAGAGHGADWAGGDDVFLVFDSAF